MSDIFYLSHFHFPYEHARFPGQASDERILYVSREARVMLWWRLLGVWMVSLVVGVTGMGLPLLLPGFTNQLRLLLALVTLLLGMIFLLLGSWWVYRLWKQSLFILTTRRLTKFIYTTPWNRYNLSLGLDKIVDTGSYARGYLQALFRIGTFTARSSAGNRRDKYFYVENVHVPEDFANYVNKLLFVYAKDSNMLETFRPFVPFLKGQERKEFLKAYPHFWS